MDLSALLVAIGALVVGLLVGVVATAAALRPAARAREAGLATERDLLRERVESLEAQVDEGHDAILALAPLREALTRVERQVVAIEKDRAQHFGALGARLEEVGETAAALRDQTASLAGALQSSNVRGQWGEAQLRRLLEHAGLLARCDFDEQVSALTTHGVAIRPDAVLRLPGGKSLVIDAKAPMTKFLAAQSDSLDATQRAALLRQHSGALRGHLDTLAAKSYWSAFTNAPEMVVAFVPSDAVLATALQHDPGLYDDALARKVVLASPSTLLALLRTVAFTWQQDSLAENAAQLLALGRELYQRLGTLGGHTTRLGAQLTRSVESYNALVGALESRVLVTARRMHELDLVGEALPLVEPSTASPRPLTASELLDAIDAPVAWPVLVDDLTERQQRPSPPDQEHSRGPSHERGRAG